MEAKEMAYGSGKSEVLFRCDYDDGTALAVVNTRGSHLCAYITFPGIEDIKDYDDVWTKDCYIHGGFTFLGTHWSLDNRICLGWDYAHAGDYTYPPLSLNGNRNEKKWTTAEVADEAYKAILCFRSGGITW